MNGTSAKLLRKYATVKGMKKGEYKALKRWWTTLNWKLKPRERVRMESELGF